jgi:hypothetical protein
MKNAIKSFTLTIMAAVLFTGCAANKTLPQNDVIKTALSKCPRPEMNILITPSYGPIPDVMAISAIKTSGNDGGFSNHFSSFIKTEPKNMSLYCANPKKLEALLLNTFKSYQNNELEGISICIIGLSNSQKLTNDAARTGVTLTFVP